MEKMFRDMDQQFNQDATVLRNAIKELKVRAGDVRPASTGTFIGRNCEVVVKFFIIFDKFLMLLCLCSKVEKVQY